MPHEIKCAGFVIEFRGRFLVLHRREDKPHGGLWGLPGGKSQPRETPQQTAARETFQETGYRPDSERLEFIGQFRFEFPDVVSLYAAFRIRLEQSIPVILNPREHSDYKWITPDECYESADMILGLKDIIRKAYGS